MMRPEPLQHPVKEAAIQTAALGFRGLLLAVIWPMAAAHRVIVRMPSFSGER